MPKIKKAKRTMATVVITMANGDELSLPESLVTGSDIVGRYRQQSNYDPLMGWAETEEVPELPWEGILDQWPPEELMRIYNPLGKVPGSRSSWILAVVARRLSRRGIPIGDLAEDPAYRITRDGLRQVNNVRFGGAIAEPEDVLTPGPEETEEHVHRIKDGTRTPDGLFGECECGSVCVRQGKARGWYKDMAAAQVAIAKARPTEEDLQRAFQQLQAAVEEFTAERPLAPDVKAAANNLLTVASAVPNTPIAVRALELREAWNLSEGGGLEGIKKAIANANVKVAGTLQRIQDDLGEVEKAEVDALSTASDALKALIANPVFVGTEAWEKARELHEAVKAKLSEPEPEKTEEGAAETEEFAAEPQPVVEEPPAPAEEVVLASVTEPEELQVTFTVKLTKGPSPKATMKLAALAKAVIDATGMSNEQAADLVSHIPVVVASGLTRDKAEEIAEALKKAGAEAEIVPDAEPEGPAEEAEPAPEA